MYIPNISHTRHSSTELVLCCHPFTNGFPGGLLVKNPPAKAGDEGSIPGSGRSPGGVNGNLLQNSCLENPTDRGAWLATVHRVRHDFTTEHTRTHGSHTTMQH